ncbi:HD-GYP domain-containing protein [Stenotrophomonas sp. PS02300]|jgi:HD-GYP domain-containing protein (c-di-GMP phosphodiesterase class II)|uniref:HD-GYP domain-containing protein n=1 Tax=Stenotrophomonas sp. PS02300 TaxID=2991426 RepID=UPI00249B2232|nr:HD-GYP domain-containing protein [Stenotrophomonas sp. PS02300]
MFDPSPPQACSIDALSMSLQMRDQYTRFHCDRVELLGDQLGRLCDLDDAQRTHLTLAARFHDIGKIGIPDNVLLHPARLDDEQRAIMRTHPERGERIFAATGRPDADEVARLIRAHHEAVDGSGYPDGLKGNDIPLGARVLTIVDSYDAMTTARPYRGAMPHAKAMGILAGLQGGQVDPDVFAQFVRLMDGQP